MKVIEWDQKCKACEGTGLYVGMGEREGSAVVCLGCKGTGAVHRREEYEEPPERPLRREEVSWVYKTNPGFGLAPPDKMPTSGWGGKSYEAWIEDPGFAPEELEMRAHLCPKWSSQCGLCSDLGSWADFGCGWGTFSSCAKFPSKAKCWERWEAERAKS